MSDFPSTSERFPVNEQSPDTQIRRVRRSRQDRVFGGVCGGLGRYLNVDPVLLRIAAVALALSGGLGVLAYIIAWIVIPEAPEDASEPPIDPASRSKAALIVGTALVALGALMLARTVLPWFDSSVFWPLVVVSGGVLLVVTARR